MTAEVVVMNKSAIALAADSKVTIGGSRMSKTYDTVNKLFTLSKLHPVGVMIYGNADFMQYPWETVIKLYRTQRGIGSEKTVADWAKDFSGYVSNFGNITNDDKIRNLKEVTRSWFASALDEADNTAISRGISIGTDEYVSLLKSVFADRISALSVKEAWLPQAGSKAFIKKFGSIVDDITKEFVEDYNDDDLLAIADQFISAAILSRNPSPLSSGIVIAGFGDDEYFPTVVSMECDGYVGDRLKLYDDSTIDVSRSMTGAVRAFAQGDMVQRFMTGLDPMLGSAIMTAFGEVLKDNCLEVLNKYGTVRTNTKSNREEVEKAVYASMSKLVDQVSSYTERAYSSPIVQMISLLPRDELANLAESLVALTSLKRRVSHDIETVGGAIDVALISKSDGFVWIKRKHYFHEDLNPQFNRNYLNDIIPGGLYATPRPEDLRGRDVGQTTTPTPKAARRSKRQLTNKPAAGRS